MRVKRCVYKRGSSAASVALLRLTVPAGRIRRARFRQALLPLNGRDRFLIQKGGCTYETGAEQYLRINPYMLEKNAVRDLSVSEFHQPE